MVTSTKIFPYQSFKGTEEANKNIFKVPTYLHMPLNLNIDYGLRTCIKIIYYSNGLLISRLSGFIPSNSVPNLIGEFLG